jgi:hypothetical protein
MKNTFYVEITDTFAGEANYSWVTRHKVNASSFRGAACIISRRSGLSWHKTADFGDQARYDSKSGATCFFVEQFDDETHGYYFN